MGMYVCSCARAGFDARKGVCVHSDVVFINCTYKVNFQFGFRENIGLLLFFGEIYIFLLFYTAKFLAHCSPFTISLYGECKINLYII